jgi:hypothetical protein
MKYLNHIFGAVLFAVILFLSSVGAAVHRVHALSVATEIVQAKNLPTTDTSWVEERVASTGNARFYYSTISTVALLGIATNIFALAFFVSGTKKRPRMG